MTSRLIVVKVGTSGITTSKGNLDEEEMQKLASQISAATKQGDKVVLVTSGAVAAGIAELGIPPKPNDLVFQQAAAATGQSVLMAKYRELFKQHGSESCSNPAYRRGPLKQGILRAYLQRLNHAPKNRRSSNN